MNKLRQFFKENSNPTEHVDLYGNAIATPLGEMLCLSTEEGIVLLAFIDQKDFDRALEKLQKKYRKQWLWYENNHILQVRSELREYFEGKRESFTVPLVFTGTQFQNTVWELLTKIPYGETWSYKKQAEKLGNPQAIRAVATANSKNLIAIIIPCHRVIGSDGSLTGYAGGLWRKQSLLNLESKINSEHIAHT